MKTTTKKSCPRNSILLKKNGICMKRGGLTQFGYSIHDLADKRRSALHKAIRKDGYATVIRRLNLVRTLSKTNNKKAHRIYNADIVYLQKHY